MQTAWALQNHAERFFPAFTQSPEIFIFETIVPYQNRPTLWGYLATPIFLKRKPIYQLVP